MAGSITTTQTDIGGGYTKYVVAWVSSAGGAVSGSTFDVKRGRLHQARFIPDSGGTQPTDAYDVTLLDSDGFDVLMGLGGNLSNAAGNFVPSLSGEGAGPGTLGFIQAGALTPTVANAGNVKGGTIALIIGP